MRSRSIALLVTTSLMFIGQTILMVPAIAAQDKAEAPAATPELQFNTPSEKKAFRAKKLNMQALRRLDCHIEGSSCASCLNSIKKTVDKLNGVYEVAVMLRKPFGFAVIYDSTILNLQKIMDAAKNDKKAKDVKFLEPTDKPITTPPPILIPIFSPLVK